jgi:hypothetical protein
MVLVRPHEIDLIQAPGPAPVQAVHRIGPLRRARLRVAGQDIEVLCPGRRSVPAVGEHCGLDLSRARVYPWPDAASG